MNYFETKTITDNYADLIIEKIKLGYTCYLVTFLFPKLFGSYASLVQQMKKQLHRVYSTFVTRVNRRPKGADADDLPILIGAFDLPVYKTNRSTASDAIFNGGMHFHALLLVPGSSRLKQSLPDHFQKYKDLYTGAGRLIQAIDVRPVIETPERALDYVFKTIKRGKISYDDGVLLLPRTRGELV